MRFPKKPTERALLEMCRRMKGATGSSVSVEMEAWKYERDDEHLVYKMWINGHGFTQASTWPEFITKYKCVLEFHLKESKDAIKQF